MRRLGCLLFLLLATAVARAQTMAPAPPAASPDDSQPPALEVMYSCPGGTDFSASFSSDREQVTLTVPGQPEIELSRERAGPGFSYSDSYYTLSGRGREATLTAAGRSMHCRAVGRPGQPARTYEGGGLTITLFPDGTFHSRDAHDAGEAVFDLGQWASEIAGGARLVLHGGSVARRVFREADGDRMVQADGQVLARVQNADPIDGPFHLAGLYRDTQQGGLLAECLTGRTYPVAPGGAEPALEKAWTEATPSRDAQLYVEIVGRFAGNEFSAERFLSLDRNGICPPPAPHNSTLRGTDWSVIEIDGEKPRLADWRHRPTLRLDDQGRYSGSTGCNSITGSYKLDTEGLIFQPAATTLKACASAQAAVERGYLDALSAVRQARIAGTTLDLVDQSGKVRLRLEARGG
jgi:heat shock protein HslJ